MKYLLCFLMAGLLMSCDTDEPAEKKDIVDPVNGVSEYLLEKSVSASSSSPGEPLTTTYSYDENGVVFTNDLWIFPENLNSSSEPYVLKGNLKLFCDSKKRVTREESGGYHTFYEYDGQDRIERKIVVNLQNSRKDTTLYTYFEPGGNNFEGASYQTRSPNYTVNPDGSITRYLSDITRNYYFSNTIKLKSWMTYPYSYGKIADAPVVRYTYTTINGSLRQETFTHTLDENGLIVKTDHNFLGGMAQTTYSYIKR